MSSTENTPVISTEGDVTSVNAEQYLTLCVANPLVAEVDTLPSAHGSRDDSLQLIYYSEDGNIRLTLNADGTVATLELWQYDADNEAQIVGVNGEGGEWVDIEGGDMWEQLSVELRGTNVAQQETIDKMAKLRGREPDSVTREGDPGKSRVTARWTAPVGITGEEEFVVVMDEGGQTLTVDWHPVAVAG